MNPQRRQWLTLCARRAGVALAGVSVVSGPAQSLAASARSAASQPHGVPTPSAHAPTDDPVRRGRPMVFPRDHGVHPGSRIEWWYATGWLGANPQDDAALTGFQLTFFRARTGLGEGLTSRFAPRHLLFAHAAISEIAPRRYRHAERLARWSGDADRSAPVRAALEDADLAVGGWTLRRETPAGPPNGTVWRTHIDGDAFGFTMALTRTQPLLLQGDAGFSRKGPQEHQASHYLSEPQLAVRGELRRDGRPQAVVGQGWLDHEWSDELLHPQAVGWDWIGINLFDGGALTAFRLRDAAGQPLWAGGSWRGAAAAPGAAAASFAPQDVQFQPGRRWRSARTDADYPVEWSVDTPAGRFRVRALMDSQEMVGGATGTVYWEGLSELRDAAGRRVGLGYLEMTGYAGPLVLLGR